MARKTTEFTVTTEGRDKGKTFQITEMPAAQVEAWAMRALLALMASGEDMPEGFELNGMAGIAEKGLKALSKLKWDVAAPLLEEMMECVKVIPDVMRPQVVRGLIESDIEEVSTRIQLRIEVWKLHTDFLQAVKA